MKRKLVYILSPSYSGSTLLTMLMAQHNNIATIGELKATSMGDINNYICSCGDKIIECAFWESLTQSLRNQGVDLDLANFKTHFSSEDKISNTLLQAQVRSRGYEIIRKHLVKTFLKTREQFQKILHKNIAVIEAVCKLQEKDIFLDGSKDSNRLLYFVQSQVWDISVIKMVRNGKAQSNSHRTKSTKGVTYEMAAKEWCNTIKQMDVVCKYLAKEKIHTIRYEDLCVDPNREMKRIWDFLKIESLNVDWREVNLKEYEHHILGNSMRLKGNIFISLDEKWKTIVSDQELKQFEMVCGETNRKLGYK